MIRLFEVDNDAKYRDFENFLFSNPYGFEFNFAEDKVRIYGVWYRLSTLYITDHDGEGGGGGCTCGALNGSGAASNSDLDALAIELAKLRCCVCGMGKFVEYPCCECCGRPCGAPLSESNPVSNPSQNAQS